VLWLFRSAYEPVIVISDDLSSSRFSFSTAWLTRFLEISVKRPIATVFVCNLKLTSKSSPVVEFGRHN